MPLAMLGWDYTRVFWTRNWGLPLLFAAILAALNGYFGFNWKLFRLLEREEWDGLIEHLEHRILERKIVLAQQCRILINAYLVRSRLDSMERLETAVRETRPRIMGRLVMSFGVRHLLSNDPAGMTEYFGEFKDRRVRDVGWIIWSYAFARLLDEDRDGAREQLLRIIDSTRNGVLLLLSAYLLDGLGSERQEHLKSDLKKRFTPEKLSSEVERQRSSVQVVILSRLIEEASEWLQRESPDRGDLH